MDDHPCPSGRKHSASLKASTARQLQALVRRRLVLRLLAHRRARPRARDHPRSGDPRPRLGRIHPFHTGMSTEEPHLRPYLHEVHAVGQGIKGYGAFVLARGGTHAMQTWRDFNHEISARGGPTDDLAVDRDAQLGGAAKGTTGTVDV